MHNLSFLNVCISYDSLAEHFSIKVWWELLHKFRWIFHPLSRSEKNFENRSGFGKVTAKIQQQFLRHTVHLI